MENKTQIICLRSDAFNALLDFCIDRIEARFNLSKEPTWVNSEKAMELLNISSRTSLQKLRDEEKIKFSRQGRKNILYDRASILQFIESNSQIKL